MAAIFKRVTRKSSIQSTQKSDDLSANKTNNIVSNDIDDIEVQKQKLNSTTEFKIMYSESDLQAANDNNKNENETNNENNNNNNDNDDANSTAAISEDSIGNEREVKKKVNLRTLGKQKLAFLMHKINTIKSLNTNSKKNKKLNKRLSVSSTVLNNEGKLNEQVNENGDDNDDDDDDDVYDDASDVIFDNSFVIKKRQSKDEGTNTKNTDNNNNNDDDDNDDDNNNNSDNDDDDDDDDEDDEIARRAAAVRRRRASKTISSLKDKHGVGFEHPMCKKLDIPTFTYTPNCDSNLIAETRRILRERYAKNSDAFYEHDYKRMLEDDWTVTRFLLRRRLDPKRTAKLMEECGRFRKQYLMSEVQPREFPIEFHKAGGMFMYARDRVGNVTMYMRTKMYRRVPEITDVFKAFILCVMEQCDKSNGGRGVAVVFDLSGCGIQNVDLSFLSWLLSSFRNYCPKGLSYILVYNLPWILNATARLAMSWMSSSNRRQLRFAKGDEIQQFIARENLPDYMNGTCTQNYRAVPAGAQRAVDVCGRLNMTREQALKIREVFKEYLIDDHEEDDEINNEVTNDNQLQTTCSNNVTTIEQQQQQQLVYKSIGTQTTC